MVAALKELNSYATGFALISSQNNNLAMVNPLLSDGLHIVTMSMQLSILYFKAVPVIFRNSADPDEMPPYAAFHLDLHCLPKYLFASIQNERNKVI